MNNRYLVHMRREPWVPGTRDITSPEGATEGLHESWCLVTVYKSEIVAVDYGACGEWDFGLAGIIVRKISPSGYCWLGKWYNGVSGKT